MVGYTLPFLPARVRMKQLLDKGAIGSIVHVTAGQLIGNMGGWLGTLEHGGDVLVTVKNGELAVEIKTRAKDSQPA